MLEFLDTRWLEFGLTGGLLVVVIVYLLKFHIPSIIKTFSEGFKNMAAALKEINTTLAAVQASAADRDQRIEDLVGGRALDQERRCTTTYQKLNECLQHLKNVAASNASEQGATLTEIKHSLEAIKAELEQLLR